MNTNQFEERANRLRLELETILGQLPRENRDRANKVFQHALTEAGGFPALANRIAGDLRTRIPPAWCWKW